MGFRGSCLFFLSSYAGSRGLTFSAFLFRNVSRDFGKGIGGWIFLDSFFRYAGVSAIAVLPYPPKLNNFRSRRARNRKIISSIFLQEPRAGFVSTIIN